VVDGYKFPFVLKHHDLIFGFSQFGIFPIIDGYLHSFGAVLTGYMEDATSRSVLVAAEASLSDTSRIVNVRI
jgi:hypothetical protein